MNKYVFDLDNSLVYTNSLNNEAYNYAISMAGLKKINGLERITRVELIEIYPHLKNEDKNNIVADKQKYFVNNLHRTIPNKQLIKILKEQPKENCLLWTSADEMRVNEILKYYKIENTFKDIIYSKKINLDYEINNICETLNCSAIQLIFFEDDINLIKELKTKKINVIKILSLDQVECFDNEY